MTFFKHLDATVKFIMNCFPMINAYACNALYTTQCYHGPVMDLRSSRHKQTADGSDGLRSAEYGFSTEVLSENTAEHL